MTTRAGQNKITRLYPLASGGVALAAILVFLAFPVQAQVLLEGGGSPPPGYLQFTPGGLEYEAQVKEAEEASRISQTQGAPCQPGYKILGITIPSDFTCALLSAIDWLVDAVFAVPFGIAEVFFGEVLKLNFTFDNAGNPIAFAVKVGHPLVLGVVNMFFVLILLWIAIATIFDFEPYTARSLLPKLIITALLINFSLPIASAFINLSHGIGAIFHDQLIAASSNKSIRGAMKKAFNVEALVSVATSPSGVAGCEGLSKAQCIQKIYAGTVAFYNDTRGTRNQVSAAECDSITGVSQDYKLITEDEVARGAACQEAIKLAIKEAGLTADAAYAIYGILAQSIAWKVVLYPIAIFVLFAVAIILLVRIISLAFVLIFGPAAFLMGILPATRFLNTMWWDRLMKWSFFFPTFMFLFWLSMIMVQHIPVESYQAVLNGQPVTNLYAALGGYFVAVAFLIGSLMVSNAFGIQGAGMVTGWGKKMAGAIGGWAKGTGKIMGGAALRRGLLQTPVGRAMASRRYTRWALRPVEAAAAAGQKVKEAREKAALARRAAAAKVSPQLRWAMMRGMPVSERADFVREMKKHQLQQTIGLMNADQSVQFYHDMKGFELGGKVLEAIRDAAPAQMTNQQKTDFFQNPNLIPEEQAEFIRPMTKTDLAPIVSAVPLAIQRTMYQNMQRYDQDEKMLDAIGELERIVEIQTGVDHTDAQRFQRAMNGWVKSTPRDDMQKWVRSTDIHANPVLQTALREAATGEDLKAIINTQDKAEAFREHLIDFDGRRKYDNEVGIGFSEVEAADRAIKRAVQRLQGVNDDLVQDFTGTPALRINLAHGRPLARKAGKQFIVQQTTTTTTTTTPGP